MAFLIIPIIAHSSYNPFFSDPTAEQPQKKVEPTPIAQQRIKAIPDRKTLTMTYFGFVESQKGKFALVNLNEKNIIIRKDDSLYLDERILKVVKITSNYILLSDRYSRNQTIYFSSETQRRQQ